MLVKQSTLVAALLHLASTSLPHPAHAQDTTAATEDPWLASGCSMAPDTALMLCLGDYASIPPAAPSALPEGDQAKYYCDIYQQLANCWATGVYCKEWYPMQLAADKFCALANMTDTSISDGAAGFASKITTLPPGIGVQDAQPTPAPAPAGDESSVVNTLSSIMAEASNVITSIWNNDSGTDIPVISNDLATETRAIWTHMTESTPLPASDPLGSSSSTEGITPVITPTARMRRKIVLN